jgi:hypothetical protein
MVDPTKDVLADVLADVPTAASHRATENSLLITLSDLPRESRGLAPTTHFPFLSPAERPDEMGRLGGYRILRLLGEGGMGYVFAAEDLALLRPVALKVLQPQVAAEPAARERFLREGQSAAAVRSPYIITIYHVSEANGVPFLVMELLQGLTLEQWLRQQPGQPDETVLLKVAEDVLVGLEAAHALGLIHRDIKPTNLWLELSPPRVKLLDFGLTRTVAAPQLTHTGTIVGTPAYMAFEQANQLPLDGRADLYSLGAVLYRMAMGRPPFERESTMATLLALALDEPPPLQGVTPALTAFIRRLMARKPEQRPASATQALAELRTLRAPIASAVPLAQLLTAHQPALNVWVDLDRDDDTAVVPVATPVATPAAPASTPAVRWGGGIALAGVAAALIGAVIAVALWSPQPAAPVPVVEAALSPAAPIAPAPSPAAPVAPAPSVPPAPVWAPRSKWLELTGQTQVELPALALTTDGPLTVEAWVCRAATTQVGTVFELRGPERFLKLYGSPGAGTWVADGYGSTDSALAYRTAPLTPAGEWTHLAVTWHGHAAELFVNGVPEKTPIKRYRRPPFAVSGAWLGRAFNEDSPELRNWFVGRLGGVRVSSPLRYTAAFRPPVQFRVDEQTTALYPCDDGTGTVLRDVVNPKQPGQISNPQWWADSGPTVPLVRLPLITDKLAGWEPFAPTDAQQTDNIIALTGATAGVMSQGTFGDFDLVSEVRLTPGTVAAIGMRAGVEPTARRQALRVRLVGAGANPQQPALERAGCVVGVRAPEEPVTLLPHHWHSVRVRMLGSKIQVWINGQRTTTVDVQAEAYRNMPAVERSYQPSGRLLLLAHGNKAEFRNVCVANGVTD